VDAGGKAGRARRGAAAAAAAARNDDDEEEEESEDASGSDGDVEMATGSDDDEEEAGSSGSEEEDDEDDDGAPAGASGRGGLGSGWGELRLTGDDDGEGEAAGAGGSDDSGSDGEGGGRGKLSRGAKKRAREGKERAIREAELARLSGDAAPKTAAEFERLVLASPDSSFVWIKYMAFLTTLGDVEKARAVAERALAAIHFRQEGEKFNVWVALLNLESLYGRPTPEEGAAAAFQRALQYTDQKKLYGAFLGILQRAGRDEPAAQARRRALSLSSLLASAAASLTAAAAQPCRRRLRAARCVPLCAVRSAAHPPSLSLSGPPLDNPQQALKAMCKKFPGSAKVWLRLIESSLAAGEGDGARRGLERALAALPRRKHVKVITQAALLEFRIGEAERGRSVFESLLKSYPKRLDLWGLYLDQEVKAGDAGRTRALFERATGLALPPKKMKSLFRRYLEYEKARGDAGAVEHVKRRALAYVESTVGGRA
jgi:rRNA biogenesis protein RRP5